MVLGVLGLDGVGQVGLDVVNGLFNTVVAVTYALISLALMNELLMNMPFFLGTLVQELSGGINVINGVWLNAVE